MLGLYEKIPGAENFTLSELCRSDTACRLGISNTPTTEVCENLIYLATTVLQPVRDHFACPIIVSSGYRGPALNRAVGGSPSSFHCLGCAADVKFSGESTHTLMELFSYIYSSLPFTELIAEEGRWVHIAIQRGREDERAVKVKKPGERVKRCSFLEACKVFERCA